MENTDLKLFICQLATIFGRKKSITVSSISNEKLYFLIVESIPTQIEKLESSCLAKNQSFTTWFSCFWSHSICKKWLKTCFYRILKSLIKRIKFKSKCIMFQPLSSAGLPTILLLVSFGAAAIFNGHISKATWANLEKVEPNPSAMQINFHVCLSHCISHIKPNFRTQVEFCQISWGKQWINLQLAGKT